MSDGVRRVVTGHDSNGKAVFASDEVVPPVQTTLSPTSSFHVLWAGDEAPRFPDDGARPPVHHLLPARRRVPVRAVHAAAAR